MKRLPTLVAAAAGFVLLLVVMGRWPIDSTTSAGAPETTIGAAQTSTSTPPSTLPRVTTTTTPPTITEVAMDPESVTVPSWMPPLLAVSSSEAWAGLATPDGAADVIGHLVDDEWAMYRISPAGTRVLGLAAGPQGTVWAATDAGVFTLEGGAWSRRFGEPTGGVSVDADGTVWIGGKLDVSPPSLWLARLDGENWTRVDDDPRAPPGPFGAATIACAGSGDVWIAHRAGYWIDESLTRFDGSSWIEITVGGLEDLTPDNGVPAAPVSEVVAGPGGIVWTLAYLAASPDTIVLAGLDQGKWTIYTAPEPTAEEASNLARLAVGDDGVVWLADGAGLFAFDGIAWETVVTGPVYAVDAAPDGAVWYADATGLHLVGA